jgi:plastocyanin
MSPRRAAVLALALCGPAAWAAEHRVLIDGMAFTPRVVQARPGDTIVWTNKDLFVHNVTADKGDLRSGELQSGQAWRYTVGAGPSIDYRCTLHPTMTARIEVGAARKGK